MIGYFAFARNLFQQNTNGLEFALLQKNTLHIQIGQHSIFCML